MNFNNNNALVTAVHRDRYEILFENETQYARLKTSCFYNTGEIVDFPTVGDEVEIQYNSSGDSLITKVLPRKTVFLRLNATQGLPDQAVAANFDYVFITMSLNKDFNITKLERYLTVAWQSGGIPVVVLTKVDLCEDKDFYVNQVNEVAIGVDCYCVSSVTGEGFQEMEGFFKEGNVSVLLGSSGVGKSSFVNLIMGTSSTLDAYVIVRLVVLGMALADYLHTGGKLKLSLPVLLLTAAGGLTLQAAAALSGSFAFRIFNDIPALFGYGAAAMLVYLVCRGWGTGLFRALAAVSYGWYLLHMLVFTLVYAWMPESFSLRLMAAPVTLGLSFLAAWGFSCLQDRIQARYGGGTK